MFVTGVCMVTGGALNHDSMFRNEGSGATSPQNSQVWLRGERGVEHAGFSTLNMDRGA